MHTAPLYSCAGGQAVVLTPLMAAIDLVSEIDFAAQIDCIDAGLCLHLDSDETRAWLKFFAFRDLFAVVVLVSERYLSRLSRT